MLCLADAQLREVIVPFRGANVRSLEGYDEDDRLLFAVLPHGDGRCSRCGKRMVKHCYDLSLNCPGQGRWHRRCKGNLGPRRGKIIR